MKRKMYHNTHSFMTARNAAIIFISYNAGQEFGYDLDNELTYIINNNPNVKKIHIYLDIQSYHNDWTPVFIEDVFQTCYDIKYLMDVPLKFVIHYYHGQFANKFNEIMSVIREGYPAISVCDKPYTKYAFEPDQIMSIVYSTSPNDSKVNLYYVYGSIKDIDYAYKHGVLKMLRFDPSNKIKIEEWKPTESDKVD